jgi:hypothetical protein
MPQVGVQIVSTALLFGIQDRLVHSLSRVTSRRTDDVLLISVAGAVSGGVLSLITCPMELLKCGLQAGLTPAASTHSPHAHRPALLASPSSSAAAISSVCRKIWMRHGVRGLYTGLTLTAMRCCVGNAAFFGIHELCWRRRAHAQGNRDKDNGLLSLLYGAVSGCAYWFVCVSIFCHECVPSTVILMMMNSTSSNQCLVHAVCKELQETCTCNFEAVVVHRGMVYMVARIPMHRCDIHACMCTYMYICTCVNKDFCVQTHLIEHNVTALFVLDVNAQIHSCRLAEWPNVPIFNVCMQIHLFVLHAYVCTCTHTCSG